MEHPWYRFAPEYKPLTSFLLYDGSINLLPIKCVRPNTIDDDVTNSMTLYMRHAVVISPSNHQVLCWLYTHVYRNIFICIKGCF